MPIPRGGRVRVKTTKTDLAYIAGIIDGEGSIGIYRTSMGKRSAAARLSLRLHVASTSKRLLEWLWRTTGVGSVSRHHAAHANWRESWQWQVRGRQAVELLFDIAPWIIVKDEEIRLACEFANTMGPVGRHELTPEVAHVREVLAQALKDAKRAG